MNHKYFEEEMDLDANYIYSYAMGGNTFATIALILAALGAAAVVLFFLPKFNKGSFGPALNAVYEFFNFHKGWSRSLIKFAYVFITIYLILLGFYIMFAASFLLGVVCMIMVLVIRVSFEVIMAFFDIRDNIRSIRNRMPVNPEAPEEIEEPGFIERMAARQAEQREAYAQYQTEQAESLARAQAAQRTESEAEASDAPTLFCSNCGTRLKADGAFCPECGAKINK